MKEQLSMRGKGTTGFGNFGESKKSAPMFPMLMPSSRQSKATMPISPVLLNQLPQKEAYEEQVVQKLIDRIKEPTDELLEAGISEIEAINLAFLYRDLAPGDEVSDISIKMMKDFLENVIKPTNESGYNKLMVYYNVLAEERSERKTAKLRTAAHNVLAQYRTIEYAYQYSLGFKEMADQMASKLDAPESMSTVERVKWIRLWVVVFCDQSLFWGDLNENGNLKSLENTKEFNERHIYPESMMFVWHEYLIGLPDGAIMYEMMRAMLSIFPESTQKIVLRYGELTANIPDSTKVAHIRELVKKLLFPRPWLVKSSHFCLKWGLENFPADRLANAVMAWKNGGIEKMSTYELPFYDVYDNCKLRSLVCYQYGEAVVNDKEVRTGVGSAEELQMYVELYKWYLAHPDFKFGRGEVKKTLKEHGMADLLEEPIDVEAVALTWIISQGFANGESDVNVELAMRVLRPENEENAKFFKDFAKGNVTAEEVLEHYPFGSRNQAIACFSRVSKITPVELNKMSAALKRINTFGVTTGTSFSDVVYLELFQYLVKNEPVLVKSYANTYKRLCPQE